MKPSKQELIDYLEDGIERMVPPEDEYDRGYIDAFAFIKLRLETQGE